MSSIVTQFSILFRAMHRPSTAHNIHWLSTRVANLPAFANCSPLTSVLFTTAIIFSATWAPSSPSPKARPSPNPRETRSDPESPSNPRPVHFLHESEDATSSSHPRSRQLHPGCRLPLRERESTQLHRPCLARQPQTRPRQTLLLHLFLDNFAGDPAPISIACSSTAKRANSISAPKAYSTFSARIGVSRGHVPIRRRRRAQSHRAKVGEVRSIVTAELARIAALPGDSPELARIQRAPARPYRRTKRQLAKLVNSPPGFGAVPEIPPGWNSFII